MKKIIVNAAIIKNRQILLVKKRDVWILPGGKKQNRESNLECLARGISEELSGAKINIIGHYTNFVGRTPYSSIKIKSIVYLANMNNGALTPSGEISEARLIDNFEDYLISPLTEQIIKSLKSDYYL